MSVPWLLQCWPLWRAHLSRFADAKHPWPLCL